MIPWLGMDTETYLGKAVLVTAEEDALAFPASFFEIVDWLLERGEYWAAFNMDYDARAIIKHLPKSAWVRLHYDTRITLPHMGRRYVVEYLNGKVFSVRREVSEAGKWRVDKKFSIFDVSQFFGGTLRKNAPKVGMEKLDIPHSWLWRMDWALERHWLTTIAYGMDDAAIAGALMRKLQASLDGFTVCTAPYSPAAVARSYFKDRLKFTENRWEQQIFKSTYKGGRIEVFRRGLVGPGVLKDIKSAYPAALAGALDPRGMTLAKTNRYRDDAFYGAYRVVVSIPECRISPLCYLTQSGARQLLIYPHGQDIETVVDRSTFALLREIGLNPVITEAWEYIVDREDRLFPEIGDLFKRRRLEPELDLAIKLTLNGLYGIMCQEIPTYVKTRHVTEESRRVAGEWRERISRLGGCTHYAVGAYTTGEVRAKVYRYMAREPENVLFVCTDGVALSCTSKAYQEQDAGIELGSWSESSRFDSAIVVGCGVYSLHEDGEWHDKLRGISGAKTLYQLLNTSRKTWQMGITNVDTLADAAREKGAEFNVIRRIKRRFDVNMDAKRVWPAEIPSGRWLLEHSQDSTTWRVE